MDALNSSIVSSSVDQVARLRVRQRTVLTILLEVLHGQILLSISGAGWPGEPFNPLCDVPYFFQDAEYAGVARHGSTRARDYIYLHPNGASDHASGKDTNS